MAKTAREERTIFCSGPNWEGDGSKETSACKFGESMTTTSERYKCSHCSIRQIPESALADADGIKKSEPKKALENQVPELTLVEAETTPVEEVEAETPVEEVEAETPVEEVEAEAEISPLAIVTQLDSPPKKKARTAKKKRRRF